MSAMPPPSIGAQHAPQRQIRLTRVAILSTRQPTRPVLPAIATASSLLRSNTDGHSPGPSRLCALALLGSTAVCLDYRLP